MPKPIPRTPELLDSILSRVSDGEPLRAILREPGMPAFRTWYDWLRQDPELSARFAKARRDGYDAIADRVRETARGVGPDASGDVKRDKLIIYTDLQLLARWDPKRYGERRIISGDDQEPPVRHEVSLSGLDADSLKAIRDAARKLAGE